MPGMPVSQQQQKDLLLQLSGAKQAEGIDA